MKIRWSMSVACAVLLVSAMTAVRAQDKPAVAAKPELAKTEEAKPDIAKVRITLPWSKLSSLSDDQWVAVNTIIEERTVRDLIPRLKTAKAQGIVEYPLNKIVL